MMLSHFMWLFLVNSTIYRISFFYILFNITNSLHIYAGYWFSGFVIEIYIFFNIFITQLLHYGFKLLCLSFYSVIFLACKTTLYLLLSAQVDKVSIWSSMLTFTLKSFTLLDFITSINSLNLLSVPKFVVI